jgi:integrase
MTTKKPSPKRSKNPLPTNGEWRDGHPMWRPQPKQRLAGWRGYALRNADGEWMSQGQAVDKINEINDAIAAAKLGEPLPEWMAAFAPAGAAAAGAPRPVARDDRTIGGLIDLYLTDPVPHFKPIKPKTVIHYRTYLAQYVATIAEVRGVPPAAIRAQDIELLAAPTPGSGKRNYSADAYTRLFATKGAAVAAATIVAAKAWFSWVQKKRNLLLTNPCASIRVVKPDARLVVWQPHEIKALIAAAEWIGFDSVADAIILALDLTWSQVDILSLTWAQIDDRHRAATTRVKTNVQGNPRIMPEGRARLATIAARWTGPDELRPPCVIRSEADSGLDFWKPDYFRHVFALVREIASAEAGPAVLGKTFQDLRPTGITRLYNVGKLKTHEVAARALQTPETAVALHKKFYHLIDQDDQDDTDAQLEARLLRHAKRAPKLTAAG